jgi:hypothetical protein
MKKGRGKTGKTQKISAKGLTKRGLRRFLSISAVAAGGISLFLLVFFLSRPPLLWYVDADLSASWNRILQESPPPHKRFEVRSRPETGAAGFPKGRYGFTVSKNGPAGERVPDAPVTVFPELSRSREYQGWAALALDPWMVFRKHQDPVPGRGFLSNRNERGSILLAGADENAVRAWLCQLLQETPGVFAGGSDLWEEKGRSLIRDYPFQSGAFSYSWIQVWPLVLRDGTVSLYAPLSQARSLPPYRSGRLDATRFPEPEEWSRYGMQADVLWAKTQGSQRQLKKFANVESWLRDARTQTIIANTINWIPAHPSGLPYNTVCYETQMAWLRSSYIWQSLPGGG